MTEHVINSATGRTTETPTEVDGRLTVRMIGARDRAQGRGRTTASSLSP
jgi:hypothetical protein